MILKSKFTLNHNESFSGIGEYYHTFTLTISDYDKQNAISDITKAPDFKPIGQPVMDFQLGMIDRYEGPKQIQNYETEDSYVREYFKPEGQGYAPTYRRIIIKKFGNELVFEEYW